MKILLRIKDENLLSKVSKVLAQRRNIIIVNQQQLVEKGSVTLLTDHQMTDDNKWGFIIYFSENTNTQANLVISPSKPILPLLSWISQIVQDSDMIDVPIEKFIGKEKICCDVFIELSRSHFVLIFRNGDSDFKNRILKFAQKGLKRLCVRKNDFYQHAPYLFSEDFNLDSFKVSPQQEFQNAMTMVYDTAKDIGVAESTIQSFNEIYKKFEILVENDLELKKILERFEKNKGTYLFNHSLLTALLGIEILKHCDWANAGHRESFCLASMIHDLGFNKAESCLYENLNNRQLANLGKEIREDIESHELGIIQICNKSPNINPLVVSLIKEHHSQFDYSVVKISRNKLSNLSALMTLTHDLVGELIRKSFRLDKLKGISQYIISRYEGDAYFQVQDTFKKQIDRLLEIN
ncbi:MAG: hypothetical protein Fur0010_11640 [Bdellovibrio sp.]